jgi:OLD-like protein
VLVEGVSDKVALETLARRRGRDLAAESVSVVPVGGAQAFGRFLSLYGPRGSSVRLAGLCDAGEEGQLRRALERAGFGLGLGRTEMERLGFYVCEADLEDELVRCLGAPVVERVLAAHGILGSFRTYQKQLAHRRRTHEEQLRGFLNNWKVRLAAPLVEALDLSRVPRPLDGVLAHV